MAANPALAALCGLGICSIAIYNIFGISITLSLDALTRTVLDACRTLAVWGFGLILSFSIDKPEY